MTAEPWRDDRDVRALPAAFADAVNRRDPEAAAALFVEDGLWLVPGVGETRGRDAIVGLLSHLLTNFESLVQFVHHGVVDIDGDRATGRWYLSELGVGRSGGRTEFAGVYQDVAVRTEEGWRFEQRRFDFLQRRSVDDDPVRGYAYPEA
jgi:uncharacterized protein (TIGR02246 family)